MFLNPEYLSYPVQLGVVVYRSQKTKTRVEISTAALGKTFLQTFQQEGFTLCGS